LTEELFNRIEVDETKVAFKEIKESGLKKIFIKLDETADLNKNNYQDLLT